MAEDFWSICISIGVVAAIVLCVMYFADVIQIGVLWLLSPIWIPLTCLCSLYCCGGTLYGGILFFAMLGAEKFEKDEKEKDDEDDDDDEKDDDD